MTALQRHGVSILVIGFATLLAASAADLNMWYCDWATFSW
jgi:hypothetical protein